MRGIYRQIARDSDSRLRLSLRFDSIATDTFAEMGMSQQETSHVTKLHNELIIEGAFCSRSTQEEKRGPRKHLGQ